MWEEKSDYLKVDELKPGHVYKVYARNFDLGVWDGKRHIIGVRHKFRDTFLFGEVHWDLCSSFGTCKPYEDTGHVIPEGMELAEGWSATDKETGNRYYLTNSSLLEYLAELSGDTETAKRARQARERYESRYIRE